MNKKISFLLVLFLIFSIMGCSQKTENGSKENANNESQNTGKDQNYDDKLERRPIVIGQTWVTNSLNPLDGGTPWGLISDGIAESVFMQNEKGELISRFVDSMEQKDDLHWMLFLKKDVYFSDGTPVKAKEFCESLNTVMKKNLFSDATAGKMNFIPKGEYEVEVQTERKTSAMNSVLAEWTNVLFLSKDGEQYVFTGPYIAEIIDPGVEMNLKPNPYYPNFEKRTNIIVKAFKDVSAMKLAFDSGELDMAFTVTPEVAKMLESEGKIVKTLDAGYQYFGIVNLKGILKDEAIRKSINLGLNRQEYIDVLQGGNIPSGIFAKYNSFAGDVKIEYNPQEAKKLLDDAGYKLNDKGLREKDGKVLSLELVTYPSRPDLSTIMKIMTEQLKSLGIQVETSIVENIDQQLKSGKFDIALYAQHTSPTGNPLFFLSQFVQTGGGKNVMGYSSPEIDRMLNEMAKLPLGKEDDKLSKEVQKKIYEDLPILYLVDPKWHIALSERLKDYTPYCGDYYIINNQLMEK